MASPRITRFSIFRLLICFAAAWSAVASAEWELTIVVVDGEGAINNIAKRRTAREPVVEIQDQNHRPVAGAKVVFQLPETGPGASFRYGARSLIVVTDAGGRASAAGMIPNGVAGRFSIRVTAITGGPGSLAYMERRATAVIEQTNAAAGATASAPPSWMNRLTGWTSLLHGKHEAPDYGLYSYLLLASAPTTFSRPRYAQAIGYFLSQVPTVQSFSGDRTPSQLNVSYLLLTAETTSMSVDWVLNHYDYARAQVLLTAVKGSHPDGPYVISTAGALSDRRSLTQDFLYQDLSSVPPQIVPLWLREFTQQAAQERFWKTRTAAQFVLRLRTNLAQVSEIPTDQPASLVAWLHAPNPQPEKNSGK